MIASTKRRKAQQMRAKLDLMNGRLEKLQRVPQKWVIVKWLITYELRCHFVRKEFASRTGGFVWTPSITGAQCWLSYAAAKKYQRSKKELAGCEIVNFTRLEDLAQQAFDATNAEADRRQKVLGDRYENPQRFTFNFES